MTTASVPSGSPAMTIRTLGRDVAEELRVLLVAGIVFGVLVAGVGSRLAMMLLRFTSDPDPRGILSDDDFLIGETTLAGTYNLLAIGAFVGVLGVGLYRLVRPWLIGPLWFRRVSIGLGCATVVGSSLVHADGVDFQLLGPTWLAVGLFVALPFLFGTFIGPTVDRFGRSTSWETRGAWRWIVPLVLVVAFPFTAFALVFVAPALIAFVAVRGSEQVRRIRRSLPYGLVLRAAWLSIAVGGLVALVGDVRDLT